MMGYLEGILNEMCRCLYQAVLKIAIDKQEVFYIFYAIQEVSFGDYFSNHTVRFYCDIS